MQFNKYYKRSIPKQSKLDKNDTLTKFAIESMESTSENYFRSNIHYLDELTNVGKLGKNLFNSHSQEDFYGSKNLKEECYLEKKLKHEYSLDYIPKRRSKYTIPHNKNYHNDIVFRFSKLSLNKKNILHCNSTSHNDEKEINNLIKHDSFNTKSDIVVTTIFEKFNMKDTIINRGVRFEKGGVVDFNFPIYRSNSKVKINNKIKKSKSIISKSKLEQSAKRIQLWWRKILIKFNKIHSSIIRIQSAFRSYSYRNFLQQYIYFEYIYSLFIKKLTELYYYKNCKYSFQYLAFKSVKIKKKVFQRNDFSKLMFLDKLIKKLKLQLYLRHLLKVRVKINLLQKLNFITKKLYTKFHLSKYFINFMYRIYLRNKLQKNNSQLLRQQKLWLSFELKLNSIIAKSVSRHKNIAFLELKNQTFIYFKELVVQRILKKKFEAYFSSLKRKVLSKWKRIDTKKKTLEFLHILFSKHLIQLTIKIKRLIILKIMLKLNSQIIVDFEWKKLLNKRKYSQVITKLTHAYMTVYNRQIKRNLIKFQKSCKLTGCIDGLISIRYFCLHTRNKIVFLSILNFSKISFLRKMILDKVKRNCFNSFTNVMKNSRLRKLLVKNLLTVKNRNNNNYLIKVFIKWKRYFKLNKFIERLRCKLLFMFLHNNMKHKILNDLVNSLKEIKMKRLNQSIAEKLIMKKNFIKWGYLIRYHLYVKQMFRKIKLQKKLNQVRKIICFKRWYRYQRKSKILLNLVIQQLCNILNVKWQCRTFFTLKIFGNKKRLQTYILKQILTVNFQKLTIIKKKYLKFWCFLSKYYFLRYNQAFNMLINKTQKLNKNFVFENLRFLHFSNTFATKWKFIWLKMIQKKCLIKWKTYIKLTNKIVELIEIGFLKLKTKKTLKKAKAQIYLKEVFSSKIYCDFKKDLFKTLKFTVKMRRLTNLKFPYLYSMNNLQIFISKFKVIKKLLLRRSEKIKSFFIRWRKESFIKSLSKSSQTIQSFIRFGILKIKLRETIQKKALYTIIFSKLQYFFRINKLRILITKVYLKKHIKIMLLKGNSYTILVQLRTRILANLNKYFTRWFQNSMILKYRISILYSILKYKRHKNLDVRVEMMLKISKYLTYPKKLLAYNKFAHCISNASKITVTKFIKGNVILNKCLSLKKLKLSFFQISVVSKLMIIAKLWTYSIMKDKFDIYQKIKMYSYLRINRTISLRNLLESLILLFIKKQFIHFTKRKEKLSFLYTLYKKKFEQYHKMQFFAMLKENMCIKRLIDKSLIINNFIRRKKNMPKNFINKIIKKLFRSFILRHILYQIFLVGQNLRMCKFNRKIENYTKRVTLKAIKKYYLFALFSKGYNIIRIRQIMAIFSCFIKFKSNFHNEIEKRIRFFNSILNKVFFKKFVGLLGGKSSKFSLLKIFSVYKELHFKKQFLTHLLNLRFIVHRLKNFQKLTIAILQIRKYILLSTVN